MTIPLFDTYPRLRGALPYIALGALPTPVERWTALEQEIGIGTLHVKCDNVSGLLYGGNKVRKLEFLLGRTVQEGVKTVLTFGAAGSNHALATALYARGLGVNCVSMLVPQANAPSVQRNLLFAHRQGAELHLYPGRKRVALATLMQFQRLKRQQGRFPQVIPPGGSSPTGCLGFVNAAFELRQQVEAGLLPEPGLIYVASGTMGTCIGLLLGLRACGLQSKVMATRVTSPPYTSAEKGRKLYQGTQTTLREADPTFPASSFPAEQFELRDEFLGEGYGLPTPGGAEAIAMAQQAGMKLEGTYTGKALAGLIADARAGKLREKNVLFWNTYNSRDFSAEIRHVDYHALPSGFHPYFETGAQ